MRNHDDHFGCFIFGAITAIIISIIFTIVVINSDLPDWMKFLILK